MTTTAKWITGLAAAAMLHGLVLFAVSGVPHPHSLVVEDVGRVGWGPLLEVAKQRVEARDSRTLIDWMPDRSGLLVRSSRMLFDSRVHVVNAPGARPRFLPAVPRNARLVGHPDQPYMVLAVDRDGDEQFALHRWDLTDESPERLTPAGERATFGSFDPTGQAIAYTSTRRNGRDFDVYVMDVQDPSSDIRLAELQGMWGVADWSPDGRELLLLRATSNLDAELFTLAMDGSGTVTPVSQLGGAPSHIVNPQWSRDGNSLLYASDREAEFSQLRRLDLASGQESILTGDIEWDVESIQQSADGSSLLIGVNESGRTRYYLGDPDRGELRPLDLFESGMFSAKMHPRDPVLLVNHADERGRVRGYTLALPTGTLTRWVGGEPTERELPAPRLELYPTFDEVDDAPRVIPAFVYPGVGDGPRPVVIDIHGGPEAQARLRHGYGASQRAGLTVITPNVRGSTGYGRTYASLDDWTLRENAVRDIGALLDWIAGQPNLDADRVLVTGGSYGGYMVLASLVHFGPRIRCGIDVVGLSNFVTFLENTADYRRDIRRAEYGDERIPEMRAFLEEISPLSSADRITSRLMVVQGANDPRVPVGESRQIVERVRENGLDVSYIEGLNEGHGFREPLNALWTGLAQQAFTRECLLGDATRSP